MPERSFRIIFPRYDNSDQPIKKKYLEDLAGELVDRFGGVTMWESVGCFRPPKKPLMCDENYVMESVMHVGTEVEATAWEQVDNAVQWMRELADRVAKELGQDSIFSSFESDSRTEFRGDNLRPTADPEFVAKAKKRAERIFTKMTRK
ncbi:hypothetical protein CMI37_08855 [Candidatus Pacearchaeota archaeon]|nr:hypothetical protein [Candidatus Pacearchaeota archaeon]|tara:strand:- start:1421 stop:1864 length:444 start_codon:yes stop_codon:yes gene_type:complete